MNINKKRKIVIKIWIFFILIIIAILLFLLSLRFKLPRKTNNKTKSNQFLKEYVYDYLTDKNYDFSRINQLIKLLQELKQLKTLKQEEKDKLKDKNKKQENTQKDELKESDNIRVFKPQKQLATTQLLSQPQPLIQTTIQKDNDNDKSLEIMQNIGVGFAVAGGVVLGAVALPAIITGLSASSATALTGLIATGFSRLL